jgi:hypothetical protein
MMSSEDAELMGSKPIGKLWLNMAYSLH